MEPILVDNEWLAITTPEGFESIPHDELEKLMGVKYDRMWGMRDTTRHVLMAITWKDSGRLLTKIASEKDVAKQVDGTFAKRYRKGGYRCTDRFERAIAGASRQAHGFRFSYTVEGVAQEGEVLVFKRGIRCYTLYYYTRSETASDNRPVFGEIIDSLEVR